MNREALMKLTNWEYKWAFELSDIETNELGAEGWELVSAVVHAGDLHLFFKRPLRP